MSNGIASASSGTLLALLFVSLSPSRGCREPGPGPRRCVTPRPVATRPFRHGPPARRPRAQSRLDPEFSGPLPTRPEHRETRRSGAAVLAMGRRSLRLSAGSCARAPRRGRGDQQLVPALWRIDPEPLTVTVHELALDADKEKDVGFSSLVYSAEHGAYFAVSEAHGSLWQVDPSLRQGRKTALLRPARETCGVELPRGAD